MTLEVLNKIIEDNNIPKDVEILSYSFENDPGIQLSNMVYYSKDMNNIVICDDTDNMPMTLLLAKYSIIYPENRAGKISIDKNTAEDIIEDFNKFAAKYAEEYNTPSVTIRP